jgi:hypothetical protein
MKKRLYAVTELNQLVDYGKFGSYQEALEYFHEKYGKQLPVYQNPPGDMRLWELPEDPLRLEAEFGDGDETDYQFLFCLAQAYLTWYAYHAKCEDLPDEE